MKFTNFPNVFVLIVSVLLLSSPSSANAQSSTSITEQYGLLGKEPNMALWYQTIKDTFRIGDERRASTSSNYPTPITDKYGSDTKAWYEEIKRTYLTTR